MIDENDFLCYKLNDKNGSEFDEKEQNNVKEYSNDTYKNNVSKINKTEKSKIVKDNLFQNNNN